VYVYHLAKTAPLTYHSQPFPLQRKCWKEPEKDEFAPPFLLRMPYDYFCSLAFTHVFAVDDAADNAMQSIRAESIRAQMRFLSDDLLEGRGSGTRGYDIAAKFMATQVESLTEAGRQWYLPSDNPVPFHARGPRVQRYADPRWKAGAYCLVGSEFFGELPHNEFFHQIERGCADSMAAFRKSIDTLLRSSAG
jgi:hypothetical protein